MIIQLEDYMPKLCTVEGCDKPHQSRGLCAMHLARWKNHGSLDSPRPERFGEKGAHPLWKRFLMLRRRKVLAPEWGDFWAFVEGVSPQPENTIKLRRPDSAAPYGPDNFEWAKTPTREESLAYLRDYSKRNHRKNRDRHFRAKYGITIDDYDALMEAQGNACAICGGRESRFVRKEVARLRSLSVDHDHETGEVRGLLCGDCNVGLGAFRDDPAKLDRAKAYILNSKKRTSA